MTHFEKLRGLRIVSHSRTYSVHDLYHLVVKVMPDTNLSGWTLEVTTARVKPDGWSSSGAGGHGVTLWHEKRIKVVAPSPRVRRTSFPYVSGAHGGYLAHSIKSPEHRFETVVAHELYHAAQFNRAQGVMGEYRGARSKVGRLIESAADRWANHVTGAWADDDEGAAYAAHLSRQGSRTR